MDYSLRAEVAKVTGHLDNVIPNYNPDFERPSSYLKMCHPRTFCAIHRQVLDTRTMFWKGVTSNRPECPSCGLKVNSQKDLEVHQQFCQMELVVSNIE